MSVNGRGYACVNASVIVIASVIVNYVIVSIVSVRSVQWKENVQGRGRERERRETDESESGNEIVVIVSMIVIVVSVYPSTPLHEPHLANPHMIAHAHHQEEADSMGDMTVAMLHHQDHLPPHRHPHRPVKAVAAVVVSVIMAVIVVMEEGTDMILAVSIPSININIDHHYEHRKDNCPPMCLCPPLHPCRPPWATVPPQAIVVTIVAVVEPWPTMSD